MNKSRILECVHEPRKHSEVCHHPEIKWWDTFNNGYSTCIGCSDCRTLTNSKDRRGVSTFYIFISYSVYLTQFRDLILLISKSNLWLVLALTWGEEGSWLNHKSHQSQYLLWNQAKSIKPWGAEGWGWLWLSSPGSVRATCCPKSSCRTGSHRPIDTNIHRHCKMGRWAHRSCSLSGMEPNRFISQTKSGNQSSRLISEAPTNRSRSCSLSAEVNCFILGDIDGPDQTVYNFCPFATALAYFPTSQRGSVRRATKCFGSSPTAITFLWGLLMNPQCCVGQSLSLDPGWDVITIYKLPALCSWRSLSAKMHCIVLLSLTRQQTSTGNITWECVCCCSLPINSQQLGCILY